MLAARKAGRNRCKNPLDRRNANLIISLRGCKDWEEECFEPRRCKKFMIEDQTLLSVLKAVAMGLRIASLRAGIGARFIHVEPLCVKLAPNWASPDPY
jgi:hypothetical protein